MLPLPTTDIRPGHADAKAAAALPFVRMNGVGNAILVLDLRGRDLVLTAAQARGIGAMPGFAFDQIMAIHDPAELGTDGFIRIYNSDGSRSGACGNGTRCVAWYMLKDDAGPSLTLATEAGCVRVRRVTATSFAVDMGPPTFDADRIPVRAGSDPRALDLGLPVDAPFTRPFAVGMGNPHGVFFVPDVDAVDLAAVGPAIEHAPAFPERANISFAQVLDRGTIKLRVWERGAGATLGCGTGACATLVAAASTGRTERTANVILPGGSLLIDWRADDDHVIMTGPVVVEREGSLDVRDAAPPSASRAAR